MLKFTINIGFPQNRRGIVANRKKRINDIGFDITNVVQYTSILEKTDIVMHHTILILPKPMLYSTHNIGFGQNQCCTPQYNIGFEIIDVVFAFF